MTRPLYSGRLSMPAGHDSFRRQPGILLAIIKELHRLLTPGGTITIKAPHFRGDGFWGDPTHVRPITPQIMGLFSKKNCRMFAEPGWPNTPFADYLDVDFETVSVNFSLMPGWGERLRTGQVSRAELDQAANSQWNVIDEITMVIRKV